MTAQSFSAAAGQRAGVPKIAIVVTDGKSNSPTSTTAAAKAARDAGIHMLAIGVGTAVDDNELNSIASDPDSQNVYKAATFDSLKSLQGLLAAKACEQVQQPPSQKTCGAQADMVFMLDSSGSVGPSNFKLLLSFVNSMVKDFDVAQDRIRIGVEEFSSRPYTEFHLNKYNTKAEVLAAVNNIPYRSGGTNTGDAIKYLKDTMFNQANGDRPGVPNIGIIITDGNSNRPDDTMAQAQAARAAGITLFSVGVGSGISRTELNAIATDPDTNHVFTVDDFSKLSDIKALFQEQACSVIPASLPPLTSAPSTSSPVVVDPCHDTLPNCGQYDLTACTLYPQWATQNCQRYCAICATSFPTVPPPCEDKLSNCASYALESCGLYQAWALDNCRKYCGYCVSNVVGTSYFNKCFYNGKSYSQGAQWSDGCAYDCECVDASVGLYRCYNKCPMYYSLPPQCTLVQQKGQCCLQPVCNFDARYQTTSGQNVGDLNGNKVCVYSGNSYYQGQTWSVGCDYDCFCEDARVGLWSCQSKCATYTSLPSICKLVRAPGECCAKPDCEFSTQVGTFTGSGHASSMRQGSTLSHASPACAVTVPADPICKDFATGGLGGAPKPVVGEVSAGASNDNCRLRPCQPSVQGETWDDGCDKHCVCENAAYGYYRCDSKCPDYYNIPPACSLTTVAGQCCKVMRCSVGTVVGSQTVSNTIGAYPIPYMTPSPVLGLLPGGTLAPGMTIPPYLTPAPGQTLAPGIVPGATLAPGITIPWNLTPAPGMTYAPTPYQTPAPLIPGETLPPGQTIPHISPRYPVKPLVLASCLASH
ncbi:hypothetical protein C0Q70_19668 [Pomacea canaliculata]|uniref:VWFA domain-containing protein n=1 Tax=Pomacea canaliculata TaxID=400727 RepID=A0A2T7NK00_POMCA|nr:hypothetical protein C0Q70_19668 [Pomacea canaliculata]